MKYYKVYEIFEDNKFCALKGKICVGIFKSEDKAKYISCVIDLQDCNKTEIIFDEINKQDLIDLHKCFKGSDCEDEIVKMSTYIFKTKEFELVN